MSTRRLILAALVCGLAIVLAGGVKLLQIATEDEKVTLLALGDEVTLGDMTVAVLSVTPGAARTVVVVSMTGVENADALEGWRMLAGGEISTPTAGPWADLDEPACTVVGSASARCSVVFPASEGTVNVAYLRAGVQSQWSTAA